MSRAAQTQLKLNNKKQGFSCTNVGQAFCRSMFDMNVCEWLVDPPLVHRNSPYMVIRSPNTVGLNFKPRIGNMPRFLAKKSFR